MFQSLLRVSIRVTFQKNQIKIYITSAISVTWLNVDDSKRCQETVIGRLQGKGLKIRNADWVKFKGIEIVIWRTKSTFQLISISMLWASLFCNQIKMPWKYRLGRSSSTPITGRTGNTVTWAFISCRIFQGGKSLTAVEADYTAATMKWKDKISSPPSS